MSITVRRMNPEMVRETHRDAPFRHAQSPIAHPLNFD
jgi:hypothetical protein